MPQYFAFLRGINLGKRRIKMDRLKAIVEMLPVTDVHTFIASGNVVLTSKARSTAKLEQTLADHFEAELGYDVPTLVRTRHEVADVVAHAPLGELWTDQPHASTQVTFFHEPLPAETADAICRVRTETDAFAVIGRELYWRCATKLTESTVWKHQHQNPHTLKHGTTRNLNTLQKLITLYPAE